MIRLDSTYISAYKPTGSLSSAYNSTNFGSTINAFSHGILTPLCCLSADGTVGFFFNPTTTTNTSVDSYKTILSGSYGSLSFVSFSKLLTPSLSSVFSVRMGGNDLVISLHSTAGNPAQIAVGAKTGSTTFDSFVPDTPNTLTNTVQCASYSHDGDTLLLPRQESDVLYLGQTISCLLEDTLILTLTGYVPIQNLKVGDVIRTTKGTTNIKKISKSLPISSEKDFAYMVPKDYMMPGKPFQDLMVSSHHLVVNVFNSSSEKIFSGFHPSCRKLNRIDSTGKIYYHLITDNFVNDIIYANGLEVETYGIDYRNKVKTICSEESCWYELDKCSSTT